MSFLDYIDNIPGKIFSKLQPRIVDGFLFFPHKFYREIFHIISSLLLIFFSHILYLYVYVSSPIIIFSILGMWMTYQEFFLHPKKYNQKLWNGVLDWSSWIVPFIIYLFYIYE